MLSDLKEDFEVCNCKKVNLKDLVNSIVDNNIRTLGEIQDLTGAGTECRHCIMEEADFGKLKKKVYCKDILKKVLNG